MKCMNDEKCRRPGSLHQLFYAWNLVCHSTDHGGQTSLFSYYPHMKKTEKMLSRMYEVVCRLYSVTAILLNSQLPSFDTFLYNCKFSFSMQFTIVVMPLLNILSVLDCNVCICMFLLQLFTRVYCFYCCYYYYYCPYLLNVKNCSLTTC